MLYWALVFFVVSIITGLLGLNGVAGLTMDVAQFLIVAFLVVSAIFLAAGIWGANKAKRMLR